MATSEVINENSKGLKDDDEKKIESAEKRCTSIALILDTKLGQFKTKFVINDLKRLKYFENQLSGRWSTDQFITISSQEICFGDTDLAQLIYYKKENKIDANHYKRERLIFLLNACDYFAETIDADTIYNYLCSSCPPITMKELKKYQLKNKNLSSAIKKCMKNMEDHANKMNDLILKQWETASMDVIINFPCLAASLFIEKFKANSAYINRKSIGEVILFRRNLADVQKLWNYIKQNKLYQQYPKIMQVIYLCPSFTGYNYQQYPVTFQSSDDLSIFAKIGADAAELICFENLQEFNINQLIENFSAICKQNSSNFLLLLKEKMNKLDKQNINTNPIAIGLVKASKYWFEASMEKETNWIINVLSSKLSLETIKPLIETISDHIAKGKKIKQEYIVFLQQHEYVK